MKNRYVIYQIQSIMSEINLCGIGECTQCMACMTICPQNCISMQQSEAGFSIPKIDREVCISCGLCVKSCHQINFVLDKNSPLVVFAAWNKNKDVRCLSSSGGIFSAFAEFIITKGGIVFGAAYVDALKVKHVGVEKLADLQRIRGSKYVQSEIGNCYNEVKRALKSTRYVLFTGSPCQVAGLYSFLGKKYETLFTCDFVCHGVPSQKAFDKYLEKINLSYFENSIFQFRDTKRWGFQLAINGCNIRLKDTYYLKAFTRGYMFMENCYSCRYATPERISDITMADFWGLGDTFNYSKRNGVSLLLINTEKGKKLISHCKDNLFMIERSMKEAVEGNYNLSNPSKRPVERDTYYNDSINLSKFQLIRKYDLSPSLRDYLRPIKRKIQSFIWR